MFLLLLLIEEVNPWISTLHGVKKMSPIRSRAPFSSFPSVAPAIIRVEKKVGSLPKKKKVSSSDHEHSGRKTSEKDADMLVTTEICGLFFVAGNSKPNPNSFCL